MRSFSAGNASDKNAPQAEIDVLDKNFDLFRAYLMLSKEQVNPSLPELGTYRTHAESTTLFETLKPYISKESKIPEALVSSANQQLEFYFQQIKRDDFPSIKLDANLVDASRKKLQAYPAWAQYYKRVTADISKKVPQVTADTILAGKGGGQGVFSATYTVPGAFTIDGYKKYMIEAIDKASQELNKDDWVMGGNSAKGQVDPQAVKNIEDKYFKDYISHWKKLIASANVPQYKELPDVKNAFQIFSDVNSPLKTFLEEVSRQTNFSATAVNQTWTEYFSSFFQSKQKTNQEKTQVEVEFEPLFKFTESKDGASELSNYGNALKAIITCAVPAGCNIDKTSLEKITTEVQTNSGPFFDNLSKVEKNIDSVASKFNTGTPGPDIAILIKKPLSNFIDLVGGGIKDKLVKDWAQVYAASQKFEKGYPFTNEGDADITELTKYLNAQNGTLSEFYKTRLAQYFEGEVPNLKLRESSEIKFDENFVKYLNNAFRLRETLFGKEGAKISYKYGVELKKVNDALIEVKIDGQQIDTNTTGSKDFTFPSTTGETGAVIELASTGDTSGGNNSANSSSPTVSSNAGQDSGSTKLPFPNAWGLLKFFDAGGGGSNKQPDGKYVLTYKLRGKTVTMIITPTGGDLFNREVFTSVKAPQNILVK